MTRFIRFSIVLVIALAVAPMAATKSERTGQPGVVTVAGPDRELPKANYDLASRWTSAKVGKYVFSTSVTPHWLEFSDRFWYDYETPAGRKWWIVDPVKKTKTRALRQREDGGATDADPPHAVRRAASADLDHPIFRQRHEDPLQRDAAARRTRRDHDRRGNHRHDAASRIRGAGAADRAAAAAAAAASNSSRAAGPAVRAPTPAWATPRGGSSTTSRPRRPC